MSTGLHQSSQDQLRRFIERIERLEEEKKVLSQDIADILKEAKGLGFDVKIMRKVLRLRKMSAVDREEEQSILDVYMEALGMLADTPLGQAAIARVDAEMAA